MSGLQLTKQERADIIRRVTKDATIELSAHLISEAKKRAEYARPEDVAYALQIGVRTLDNIDTKRLPRTVITPKKLVRYKWEDVEKFNESNREA